MLYQLSMTPVSVISSVILMLRTYAFSGRSKKVLAVLSISFLALASAMIWVTSKQLTRLSRKLLFIEVYSNSSMDS